MIAFRNATLDDLKLLRHWDTQSHVLASDPDSDWEWETELAFDPEWREQLIAELDGRPIGFVQIIDPEREIYHYWGDCGPNLRAIDIWIGEPDCLGKGYGTQMMQLAIERCFADPEVSAILIDPLESNTRAHKFYQRLGYQIVGPRRFDTDDCLVMQLTRERWTSHST